MASGSHDPGWSSRGAIIMMVAVFATMALAILIGQFGPRWLAAICLVACFGLFVFEIYSPNFGFRMPWLQSFLDAPAREA
jgi:hypothetical protein